MLGTGELFLLASRDNQIATNGIVSKNFKLWAD